jgi:hypothetical protein
MPQTKSTKGTQASGGKHRGTGRRERISPRGDARFVRRDAQGHFKESDDVGRSLAADRRTKAKTTVKSGHGDQGDQKRSSRRSK